MALCVGPWPWLVGRLPCAVATPPGPGAQPRPPAPRGAGSGGQQARSLPVIGYGGH